MLHLLVLVLVVVRFPSSVGRIVGIEDTHDTRSDFVVDDSLVVLANDINAELLFGVKFTLHEHNKKKTRKGGTYDDVICFEFIGV